MPSRAVAAVLLLLLAACPPPSPPQGAKKPTRGGAGVACNVEKPCDTLAGSFGCVPASTARPCDTPACDLAQWSCKSTADCNEGFSCVPCQEPGVKCMGDNYCAQTECITPDDCTSPNLTCTQNRCLHVACEKSADCKGGGQCVAGECWNVPGFCLDTSKVDVPF